MRRTGKTGRKRSWTGPRREGRGTRENCTGRHPQYLGIGQRTLGLTGHSLYFIMPSNHVIVCALCTIHCVCVHCACVKCRLDHSHCTLPAQVPWLSDWQCEECGEWDGAAEISLSKWRLLLPSRVLTRRGCWVFTQWMKTVLASFYHILQNRVAISLGIWGLITSSKVLVTRSCIDITLSISTATTK